MSVRVRYRIELAISSTSAEERDLGNSKYEVVVDSQGEGGSRKFTLAAGVVDAQMCLGDVTTAKFVAIRTNAKDPNRDPNAILIRRNLITAEQILVAPLATAKEGHLLLSTDGLTALFGSNPGSTDMEITLFVAGD